MGIYVLQAQEPFLTKTKLIANGYVVKTLEVLVWLWEKEEDKEEFSYNKATCKKINKGH